MKLPKMLKRALTAGLAVAFAFGVAGCGDSAGKENFINIATGGTAGTYYPIGGAMAEVLNKDVYGMNASAQSTGASVANINMLADGQVEMAIVQNDIAYYAVNGTEIFDKKIENLRGIASLYPETCQFVTLADSGQLATCAARELPLARRALALKRMFVKFSRLMVLLTMTLRSNFCPLPKGLMRLKTAMLM